MINREEALKLADDLKDVAEVLGSNNIEAAVIGNGADMIRKLVAELEKQVYWRCSAPPCKCDSSNFKQCGYATYTAPRELSAKESYDKACIDGEDKDPIERLRFYCSLAMTGQDWLDAEPFFDALKSAPRELSDDEVVIPRELAASYLKITEVPRYKRILEDALKKASEK